jgi:hypothetical protein
MCKYISGQYCCQCHLHSKIVKSFYKMFILRHVNPSGFMCNTGTPLHRNAFTSTFLLSFDWLLLSVLRRNN